jgi:DNA-binding MarR family transcriptional regulator
LLVLLLEQEVSMKVTTLSHSDQLVSTIAKLPCSTFGTYTTKEVALVLARHMNKPKGWSACLYLRTIAQAVGCTTRTVRNALRRLEALGFIRTEHRKHDTLENWNLASVYRMGEKLCSMFNQLFRTPGKQVPGKPLASSKQKQSDKEKDANRVMNARKRKNYSKSGKAFAHVDTERLTKTPEEWAKEQAEGIEHNRRLLERIRGMLGQA